MTSTIIGQSQRDKETREPDDATSITSGSAGGWEKRPAMDLARSLPSEEAPFLCTCGFPPIELDQEARATTDSATERVPRSLSCVTGIWPKGHPLVWAFRVPLRAHRHASIRSMAPALASVSLVTLLVTPCGPSARRFVARPSVTSPSF